MTFAIKTYYTAKDKTRVRCSVSTFELPKGAKIFVEQVDSEYKKVLVRYGDRDIDWMPMRVFEECFVAKGSVTL